MIFSLSHGLTIVNREDTKKDDLVTKSKNSQSIGISLSHTRTRIQYQSSANINIQYQNFDLWPLILEQ